MRCARPTFIAMLLIFITALAVNGQVARTAPKKRTVVIIKFATHPALDETEAGVLDVLNEAKRSNPALANLEIQRQNANGNPQLAKQLAETATQPEVDVIVAIATPAAQAVARTPSSIPLIYGAVADPQGAGILQEGRATGIRNVGENIIDRALMFMRRAFPRARRLGTIFNPAEQNSVYVQEILKRLAPKHGFELKQTEVLDKAQVASAAELLSTDCDLIYSANDNTVNAAVASVVAVARSSRKPFILGDLSTLASGAFAAIGLEYRSMGRDVGAMALKVINGAPISSLPAKGAPEPHIWLNLETARALNIVLPKAAAEMVNKSIGK
jgi:putative tryptophan/tyrosine transport system substrate-binding protein